MMHAVLTREICLPCLLEPDPLVALGICETGDADGFGDDAEGPQQTGELLLGERLSAFPLRPWPLRIGCQLRNQVGRSNGTPNANRMSARSSTLIEGVSRPSPERMRAASLARFGHAPPARSAIARSGRQ